MLEKGTPQKGYEHCWIIAMMGMVLMSIGGCAADPPKPAQTMTPDQVRSNAEKAFDKLKQEEKNRPVGPGASPY